MPLVKVDGTKHLATHATEKHIKFLDLHYLEGRAGKAAQLHAVDIGQQQIECEGEIIEQEQIEINEAVIGKSDEKLFEPGLDEYADFGFANGRSDSWGNRGEGQRWCRIHRTPRRALFTPYKVARGPGRKTKLRVTRITEGINQLGQKFSIKDDWTNPERSHRRMAMSWIGKTTFEVDPEEDITLGGDYRRHFDQEHMSPLRLDDTNATQITHAPDAIRVTSNQTRASARPRLAWVDMGSADDA